LEEITSDGSAIFVVMLEGGGRLEGMYSSVGALDCPVISEGKP
jgi:hypothetical protein